MTGRVEHDLEPDVALGIALDAAVALRLELLLLLDAGEFARRFERGRLQELAETVAAHGDYLMFRSTGKQQGTSARVFNAVAEGLALLAFAPGGVTLFGRHWQATRAEAVAGR